MMPLTIRLAQPLKPYALVPQRWHESEVGYAAGSVLEVWFDPAAGTLSPLV